jgi:hypothetical protein
MVEGHAAEHLAQQHKHEAHAHGDLRPHEHRVEDLVGPEEAAAVGG